MRQSISRTTALRRARPTILTVAALVAVGGAQAAWQVTDQEAQRRLGMISDRLGDGNVNRKLAEIHDANRLGQAGTSGEREPEPTGDEGLSHSAPSTVHVGADVRCPRAAVGVLAAQQRQLCEEIVKTERAKYMYSLRMYRLTEERYKRLGEIEQERRNLGAHEIGKLEDNSNKLLALTSLMQIDRQQHATYMAAYDARMAYLTSARDALTRQAMEGAKTASSFGAAVIGGGTLVAALRLARTERRERP